MNLVSFAVRIAHKNSLVTISEKLYSYPDVETLITLENEHAVKIGFNQIEAGSYYIFFIAKDVTGNISFLQNELLLN